VLSDALSGLAANLKFSNGAEIIWRRLMRRGAGETTYVWRHRLRIACDGAKKDHVALQEIFCRDAYVPWLEPNRDPGRRLRYVNIGAHIGAFDLWLLDRGCVIESSLAAELNPATFRRARRNLATNGLSAVQLVNCGIADEPGFIDFVASENSLSDGIFASRPDGAATSERVELLTLAGFVARHAGADAEFDLLKLDCEGAEYGIVRSTPGTELRRFNQIVVEFHPEPPGESVTAAYTKLREAGFASVRGGPAPFRFMDTFVRQ
jgi:FkbM family methyltransferase